MDLPKWELGLQSYKRLKIEAKPDLPDMWPTNPRWNLLLPRLEPYFKRRHLWIWSSKPDTGKSWFLLELQKNYRAHFYNKSEKFQSFPESTQVILIDEYTHATLRSTEIN